MRGRFLHGVASGDPLPDAIILWTRLTPIEQTSEVPVQWQIWEGNKLLLSGQEKAKETQDFTVKVDVHSQLFQPSVLYRYRFDAGDAKSPLGQFRLPPAPSQPLHRLDYAIFSCANRGFGNFRAYSEALDRSPEGLDFWLHLGDYIYEYGQQKYPNPSETRVPGLQPPNDLVHLQDYRQRHAYYRLDADLQRLSAAAPLISIWDDHEVANDDFVDGAENHRSDQGSFEARKRAAIRAYHEWLPTRPNFDPSNTSAVPWMRWRRFDFGGLATLLMLETRLWARTSQAEMTMESVHNEIGGVLDGFLGVSPYAWPGGEIEQGLTKVRSKVEAHRKLPQKRMLGEEQLSWISNQVKEVKEGQKWLLVGQAQVVQDLMSPNFFQAITEKEQGDPDTAKYWAAVLHNVTKLGFPYQDFQAKKNLTTTREIKNPFLLDLAAGRFGIQLNFDSWTGYLAEQRRLIEVLGRAVPTPIVYGGDSHNAWAGLLRDGDGKAVALDFDGMAVTSPGVEHARPFIPPDFEAAAWHAANPDLIWADTSRRGFMLVHLDSASQHIEYIAVDVEAPSAGASMGECLAAFDVNHGEVGIQRSSCRTQSAQFALKMAMVPVWSLFLTCCLGTVVGGMLALLLRRQSKRKYEHCAEAENDTQVTPSRLGSQT